MKGGLPERINDYSLAEVNELKIYIPKDLTFTDEFVKIIDFKKRNGMVDVGVSNVKE